MSAHVSSRTRKRAAFLIAPVVVAAALTACSSSGSGGGGGGGGKVSEIRIGLDFPTSGGQATLGTDMNNATKMMLQYANDHGGINGAKIKIFEGDSQSDPGTGATVAQRLIDQDHVTILIGSYASGIAQAIVPVAQRNHVMLWEVGAVAPGINPKGNQFFLRTLGDSGTYAAADIGFLKDVLAPKIGKPVDQIRIGVAHEDGPFGTSVADAIVQQGKQAGLNIVDNIAYKETTPDMTPVVLRLKKDNPDVVFITPLPSSTPLFWQAARTQNLQMKAIIGSAGFSSSAFVKKFGAQGVEGAYDVEAPSVAEMNSANLQPDAKNVLDTLRAKFAKDNGHPCAVHCGDGLGGTYILTHYVLPKAISQYGSASPQAIWKAAHEIDVPTGGTPQGFGVKFNDAGDNTRAESVIMQWQKGVLQVVWPKNVAAASPEYPMPTWSER